MKKHHMNSNENFLRRDREVHISQVSLTLLGESYPRHLEGQKVSADVMVNRIRLIRTRSFLFKYGEYSF